MIDMIFRYKKDNAMGDNGGGDTMNQPLLEQTTSL